MTTFLPPTKTSLGAPAMPAVGLSADQRITVFIGGAYRTITRAQALAFARAIVETVDESCGLQRRRSA